MTRSKLDALLMAIAFALLVALTYLASQVAALLWLAWQTGWRP